MPMLQQYFVSFLIIFVGWASFSDSSYSGERWAVLVAGSNGWKNYRHQANVCNAYQILRKGGLKEENIIIFMYDDIAHDEKNPEPGKIFHEKDGNDVYQGVPKDYTGKYVTSLNFYNVLRGYGNDNIDMKVLRSGPTDNIFIYFTGFGFEEALGMPREGDFVHRDDFLSVLTYMHQAKLYKQMVMYVDAGTKMFEGKTELEDAQIFITTSSNAFEDSLGFRWIEKWHTTLTTMYSAAWMEDSKTHNLSETTLNEQYERVKEIVAKDKHWGSHVKKYGSERVGKNYVSEFFQIA